MQTHTEGRTLTHPRWGLRSSQNGSPRWAGPGGGQVGAPSQSVMARDACDPWGQGRRTCLGHRRAAGAPTHQPSHRLKPHTHVLAAAQPDVSRGLREACVSCPPPPQHGGHPPIRSRQGRGLREVAPAKGLAHERERMMASLPPPGSTTRTTSQQEGEQHLPAYQHPQTFLAPDFPRSLSLRLGCPWARPGPTEALAGLVTCSFLPPGPHTCLWS